MKIVTTTPYLPPEMELLPLEGVDILTTSGPEDKPSDGYVSDDNVDYEW